MRSKDSSESRLRENVLEAQVEAAFQGHDLGPFEPVENTITGFQAVCRKCGQSIWVGKNGLMYSLLGERCNIHENTNG
jgi:hypothetical protein